ncbi:MAG: zinc ribbon domain-containing protein [Candidatus Omnitrophica bacterium]|nr:zinc ribbon domain-containing protein [Candidatus Omnitrophota bacterium]MBU1524108.1 zinc ribbon domain-containing protein [Candidatus Omnitrophota bacterium]
MPTYEYVCNNCNNLFEEFQSIYSNFVSTCPSCNAEAKKLFSKNVNFIFKGAGFFATDYCNKDYKEKLAQEKKSIKTTAEKTEKE